MAISLPHEEQQEHQQDDTILAAVIEDELSARRFMLRTLTREGCRCLEAADGETGLQLIEEHNPDIVFLDVLMPRMTGLEVLQKIREKQLTPIVVITTAYGTEDTAVEALRLRADDYMKKPFEAEDLVTVLNKYRPVIAALRSPTVLPEFVVSKQCDVEFGNDLTQVAPVAEFLVRESEMGRDRQRSLSCTLGLVELLNNAIEHGNLGITADEKLQAMMEPGDGLGRLMRARRSNPEYVNRRVRIHMVSTREYAEWLVQDEGAGFDWQQYMSRLECPDPLALHGRGIMLAQLQFDELEYQGSGNRVRARKYKSGLGGKLRAEAQATN